MGNKNLGAFSVAMIIIATVVSAIGMQIMAEYGLQATSFYLIASLLFFIPTAVASAALAKFNSDAGLYGWIDSTIGKRTAFLAVWLQWISTVIFYPTVLAFLASIIGYLIDPRLTDDSYYMFFCMLSFGWLSVLANLFGPNFAVKLSSIGAFFAAIFPAVLVAIAAALSIWQGYPAAIKWDNTKLLPSHMNLSNLSLLASFVVAFAGIEYSSYFVKYMRNPQRSYTVSIIIAVITIILLNILGTWGITILVKQHDLNLMTGFMQAFSVFFTQQHTIWLIWIVGLAMGFGFLSSVSTMMIAVALGVLVLAENQLLPKYWVCLNRHGAPSRIIIGQGLLMTLLALLYLFLPKVKEAYWITGVAASLFLGIKYIIMFVAAMRSCKTYRLLMYLIYCIGILSCILVITLTFIPPEIGINNIRQFELIMFTITGGVILVPLVILYRYKLL